MRFSIDIDNKKVAEKIERRIERGIENSQDEITRGIKREAKSHIRREQAIFRHELIEGFVDADLNFGGHYRLSVRNVSDHAPAQEYGVSGVEEKRDTPLSFTTKMPPVTALIPWVRAHLTGTGFDPNWNPQDVVNSPNNNSGGNGGGGGGSSGGKSGGNDGNIASYDGYSASPLETEADRTVFVGDRGEYGVIDSVTQGDDGVIDGAVIAYIESDYIEELPLADFEVVPEDQEPIMVDSNRKYVPGINFKKHELEDSVDLGDTHPFQQVVVLDQDTLKYRRGELVSYPDNDGFEIRVQFHDNGAVNDIQVDNQESMKIVGTRFWDSNTRDEKENLLRQHFNENVIGAAQNKNLGSEATEPTQDRLEWVRDNMIGGGFPLYKDDYDLKEIVRNYEYQRGMTDSLADGIGGRMLHISGRGHKLSGQFQSPKQVRDMNYYVDEDDYIGTLRHETMHGFHFSKGYGKDWQILPKNYDYEKQAKTATWNKNGNNQNRILRETVDRVDPLLMRNHDDTSVGIPGGTSWLAEAWKAAKNGNNGIKNYSPNFGTPEDQKTERLMEAVNHAFWLQTVRVNDKLKNSAIPNINETELFYIQRKYSFKNAPESLTTLREVMTDQSIKTGKLKNLIRELDEFYPWLIEAYLGKFNPGRNQKKMLEKLGYDV